MLMMSQFTDANGRCSIYGKPSETFQQDEGLQIKELAIENCPYSKFVGKVEVIGNSKVENTIIEDKLTTSSLVLIKNSPKLNIKEIFLDGLLSLEPLPNGYTGDIKVGK